MKHYRILILAAIAALTASCSVKEDAPSSSRAIRFTTNLGDYATRATDTGFEQGDAVSLFAEAPINELNVKMTFNGSALVPEKDIFWPEGMKDGEFAHFFAVYPYRKDWEDLSDLSVFSVNADQRTHELYTASDLLGAAYMAFPDCETVPLNFTHRLSRVTCSVAGLGDEKIADVYLDGVFGKVRLNLSYDMYVYAVGEKGTVRMGQTDSWSNSVEFTAVVPPQQMDFRVLVVTESGKQYTFKRSKYYGDYYMESAHSYQLHMELDYAEPVSEFDVTVSDWTADNDLQFGSYVADEYQNEGTWYLVTTGDDGADVYKVMYNGGSFIDGSVEAGDTAPYRFYYRKGRRTAWYGIGTSSLAPGQYSLVEDGEPFSWGGNEPLSLRYNIFDRILTVAEDNDVWSVIGSFDGWNGDLDMTRVSHGIYTIDLEYWDEEFKFRCNHSWETNIGNYDEDVLADQPDNWFYLTAPDGLNFRIASPGVYRLTLDAIRQRLNVKFLAELKDETFEAMLGSWLYEDTNIDIQADGGNLLVNFGDVAFTAEYDHVSKSFCARFNRLGEWNHDSYGLIYDYFYAFVKDSEGNITASHWGEDGQPLYYGTLSGDVLEITPAEIDGTPFTSFKMIGLLQEGDYAGAYFDYFGDLPLPQTWTRVND